MFGPKLTQVFASRWKAALWAMGVLLTAYCTVPAAEEVREQPAKAAKPHTSPWAKDESPAP